MNHREILKDPQVKMDMLMTHVSKLLAKNKRQILDKFELTCSQFDILTAIYYFTYKKVEIIQVDLSEKTGIDPMTTSTILRNLQKKGLITRNRSIVNTRTVIVELTQDGMAILEKASIQIKSSSDLIYKDINRNDLTSQLLKLSDKLNKLNY